MRRQTKILRNGQSPVHHVTTTVQEQIIKFERVTCMSPVRAQEWVKQSNFWKRYPYKATLVQKQIRKFESDKDEPRDNIATCVPIIEHVRKRSVSDLRQKQRAKYHYSSNFDKDKVPGKGNEYKQRQTKVQENIMKFEEIAHPDVTRSGVFVYDTEEIKDQPIAVIRERFMGNEKLKYQPTFRSDEDLRKWKEYTSEHEAKVRESIRKFEELNIQQILATKLTFYQKRLYASFDKMSVSPPEVGAAPQQQKRTTKRKQFDIHNACTSAEYYQTGKKRPVLVKERSTKDNQGHLLSNASLHRKPKISSTASAGIQDNKTNYRPHVEVPDAEHRRGVNAKASDRETYNRKKGTCTNKDTISPVRIEILDEGTQYCMHTSASERETSETHVRTHISDGEPDRRDHAYESDETEIHVRTHLPDIPDGRRGHAIASYRESKSHVYTHLSDRNKRKRENATESDENVGTRSTVPKNIRKGDNASKRQIPKININIRKFETLAVLKVRDNAYRRPKVIKPKRKSVVKEQIMKFEEMTLTKDYL